MNVLFAFILALTIVKAAEQVSNTDLKFESYSCRGLSKDLFLYGSCKQGLISFFDNEVNAAKKCNDEKNYRCFKACQFEKMGISDSSGNIDRKKFIDHWQEKLAGLKNETMSTNYLSNITVCLSNNGNKVVPYTAKPECDKNEHFLQCMINTYHLNCVGPITKNSTPRPVPS